MGWSGYFFLFCDEEKKCTNPKREIEMSQKKIPAKSYEKRRKNKVFERSIFFFCRSSRRTPQAGYDDHPHKLGGVFLCNRVIIFYFSKTLLSVHREDELQLFYTHLCDAAVTPCNSHHSCQPFFLLLHCPGKAFAPESTLPCFFRGVLFLFCFWKKKFMIKGKNKYLTQVSPLHTWYAAGGRWIVPEGSRTRTEHSSHAWRSSFWRGSGREGKEASARTVAGSCAARSPIIFSRSCSAWYLSAMTSSAHFASTPSSTISCHTCRSHNVLNVGSFNIFAVSITPAADVRSTSHSPVHMNFTDFSIALYFIF